MKRLLPVLIAVLIPAIAGAGPYRFLIASTPDGSGSIYVDDDLTITLEKKGGGKITVLNDSNGKPSEISPVFFYAEYGDKLIIEAKDAAKIDKEHNKLKEGHRALSPLYLINTELNEVQMISAPFPSSGSIGNETFVKIEYTIGTPLKEYCMSSSPDTCKPLYVDDDLSLVSVSYGSAYTAELHPNTDRSNSYIEVYIMIPEDRSSRYGVEADSVLHIEFTNYKRNGYVTPVYLVPVDGKGPVLTILDHPLSIEGGCEENCTDTVMYEFNGTLSYILPPITEGEKVDINISKVTERYKEGLFFDIVAPSNSTSHLILYWPGLYSNVFYTPDGYSRSAYVFSISGHHSGTVWVPDYSPWQKLLTDGNHTIGVAVVDKVVQKKEFSFLLPPADGSENFTPQGINEAYLKSEPTSDKLTDLESYVADVTRDAFRHGQSTSIIEALVGKSSSIFMGCVNVPTLNGTREYCFVFPEGRRIHNGLALRYDTSGNVDLIFTVFVYCKQKETVSANSTFSSPISQAGNNTTVEVPCTPDPNALDIWADFELKGSADVKGRVYLTNDVSVDPRYLTPALRGGVLLYNYYHIPISQLPTTVTYTFRYRTPRGEGGTQEASYSIAPPKARVWAVDRYPGGLKVTPVVNDMGYANLKFEFKLQLKPFGNHSPDFSTYNASVCLVRSRYQSSNNATTGEKDVCTNMEYESNGVFKSVYYIDREEHYTDPNSVHVSYWFVVTDPKGDPVPGELVFKKYTYDYSFGDGVALTISGSHSYTLGSPITLTLGAQVEWENRDRVYDIYLGVYKEGRGVVWLYDDLPGAGVLKTSYERKPFATIIGSDCAEGCYADISIPTESLVDFYSPLFIGDYVFVLEFSDHYSKKLVGRTYFPFTVKTIR